MSLKPLSWFNRDRRLIVGGKSQNPESQNIYGFEADILIRLGQRGQWGENPKIFMSLKPISWFDRNRGGLVGGNPRCEGMWWMMDNGGLAAFIRSPTHRGGSNFFQHAQIITKKNLKNYLKYLLCKKKNENLNRAFMHELFQHAFDIEVVWAYKWYLN